MNCTVHSNMHSNFFDHLITHLCYEFFPRILFSLIFVLLKNELFVWRCCPINSFAMHNLCYRNHVLMRSENGTGVGPQLCMQSHGWELDWLEVTIPLVSTQFSNFFPVLRIRSGIRWLLAPGSGKGKKSRYGIRIRDEHPGSYFQDLRNNFWVKKILKFFDADPDPGSGIVLTLDPGWKNSDPDPGFIEQDFLVILGWLINYPWPFRIRVLKEGW